MPSPAGRRVSRGAEARRTRATGARRLLPGTALLLCGSLPLFAADVATGLSAAAPPEPPSTPSACGRLLRAIDSGGVPIWQTIAVALPRAERAASPLHVLERGGRRPDRIEISDGDGGWIPVAPGTTSLPESNLALLAVPGLPACGGRGRPGDAGAGVEILRERVGYRSATIGARVERRIGLGAGGEVTLLRLLDERGADPGLVFDAGGNFLGATLPAPPAAKGSLAALAPFADDIPEIAGSTTTALPEPRPSPSAAGTPTGYVAQALLDGGPGAGERGIDLLGAAMRAAGPSAALLVERGVREFTVGRMAPAIEDFRRATALDPASHLARYNLGIALGTAGQYADAAAALEAARDLDPGHGRTRYQLILALSAARRTDEARRELETLLALDPLLAQDLRTIPGL